MRSEQDTVWWTFRGVFVSEEKGEHLPYVRLTFTQNCPVDKH